MASLMTLTLSVALMVWGCNTQRPTLTGQRTRQRMTKERFRDQIVTGLNKENVDMEQASKFLIQSGSKLDFRQHSETLYDVLIACDILAPGGLPGPQETVASNFCVFKTEADVDSMRSIIQLFERLIRQYKYLEKSLNDEMTKVLKSLREFSDAQRTRLVTATYLMISTGVVSTTCLSQLTSEHLVKDEIAFDFAHDLFALWLKNKDFASLIGILKKADIDDKLMELLPVSDRSVEAFEDRFSDLGPIVDFQRNTLAREAKKALKAKLKKLFGEDSSAEEVIATIKQFTDKNNLESAEVTTILWGALMGLEWEEDEDVLAEHATAHLKKYAPALAEFATTAEIKLLLLQNMQEYCYDNMKFLKLFQKMVMLLNEMDVISEDAIIAWYETGVLPKGKSVFLQQMKETVEDMSNGDEARKFLLVHQGSELTKSEKNFKAVAFNCVLVSAALSGVGCFIVAARRAYIARSTGFFHHQSKVELVEEAEGQWVE